MNIQITKKYRIKGISFKSKDIHTNRMFTIFFPALPDNLCVSLFGLANHGSYEKLAVCLLKLQLSVLTQF